MATLTDGSYMPPEMGKKLFLEQFAELGSVTQVCTKLGIVRRTIYHWKQTDPEFAELFKEAEAMGLQALEDEAHRRAVLGVERPVYQGGKKVGTVQEYSDTLLIVLLKARAPHKYKERFAGELSGPDGRPLGSEMKIIHVQSNVPLTHEEAEVARIENGKEADDIDFEMIKP
jgi:hypothetical protein